MPVLSALRSAGVEVHLAEAAARGQESADALLEVTSGGTRARFAVEEKTRAPYPNELPRYAARQGELRELGQPVLVAPFVSRALADMLIDAGWSWADTHGNFDLRAPGLLLRQRLTLGPPRTKRRSLPQGAGALGIIRALVRFGDGELEDVSATRLASQAGVSQPRASQVLGQLYDLGLVTKATRGRWVPLREELLDRFLAEYRGPGGSERHLYSLDAPLDVAVRAALLRSERRQIAVSADVAPDLVVSWRRPTTVILYVRGEIAPRDLGVVDAQGRHDANVIVRAPADRSVFRDRDLLVTVRDVEVPLADETQLIWDLQDLGGADRLEAAGMMREWLLNRP